MKTDLQVWMSFLRDNNGVTVISNNIWVSDTKLQILTDSAGRPSWGFGIYRIAGFFGGDIILAYFGDF
jgi:hypothetical protein